MNPINVAGAAASKSLLPWVLLAALLAGCTCVGTGMYLGYELAQSRNLKEWGDLKDAQLVALQARADQYATSQKRGDEIAGRFETLLKNIKVENKTYTQEIRHEVEKIVYTDCKLPDSGADLLQKHVDAANLRARLRAQDSVVTKDAK